MDIVKRAYLQVKTELPDDVPISYLHQEMVKEMVRWIKLGAYPRRDWPTRELGEYPKHLEAEVK